MTIQLTVILRIIFHRTSLKSFVTRIPYKRGGKKREKQLASSIDQNCSFDDTKNKNFTYMNLSPTRTTTFFFNNLMQRH